VAEPMLTLSANAVSSGYPVEMTYRFRVSRDVRLTNNYHVMVHFADSEDHLLFVDDHDPPSPSSTWKAGQDVEYHRTWFVPTTPYVGHLTIEIALYGSAHEPRAPLLGTELGQRSYVVGSLDVKPQSERPSTVYAEGWHAVERSPDGSEWRWTKKEAVIEVANPRKDCALYLAVGNRVDLFDQAQRVSVFAGGMLLDQLVVAPQPGVHIYKVLMPAAALGGDATARIRLVVDKTFVPAQLSPSLRDTRELGIQVLHAAIVPSP